MAKIHAFICEYFIQYIYTDICECGAMEKPEKTHLLRKFRFL